MCLKKVSNLARISIYISCLISYRTLPALIFHFIICRYSGLHSLRHLCWPYTENIKQHTIRNKSTCRRAAPLIIIFRDHWRRDTLFVWPLNGQSCKAMTITWLIAARETSFLIPLFVSRSITQFEILFVDINKYLCIHLVTSVCLHAHRIVHRSNGRI